MPKPLLYDVKMVDVRPLLPAKRQDDADRIYGHEVTPLAVDTVAYITVPKGVRYVLVQARDQDINYTISGDETDPSQTSGFILVSGNDPLAISVLGGQKLAFIASAAGAILEHQFCQ